VNANGIPLLIDLIKLGADETGLIDYPKIGSSAVEVLGNVIAACMYLLHSL